MGMSHIGAQIGKQGTQIPPLFHPTVEPVSRECVAKIIRPRRMTGRLTKSGFAPAQMKHSTQPIFGVCSTRESLAGEQIGTVRELMRSVRNVFGANVCYFWRHSNDTVFVSFRFRDKNRTLRQIQVFFLN